MSEELKLKLEELEQLSIKISDNISDGHYDEIVQLDLKRQNIIKSINPNHAISFKNEISNLLKTNVSQVREVEKTFPNLKETLTILLNVLQHIKNNLKKTKKTNK